MTDEIKRDADGRMSRAIEALERELATIRTGRAATALVERIQVEYYGTNTPLNQLASISVPEAHSIVIHGFTHREEMKTRGDTLIVNPGEGGGWLYGSPSGAILDLDTRQVDFFKLTETE